MKILALRGENLASLSRPFSIEFDASPLQDSGLFAISGRTGAGKSTLLDAICLALYDAIPRLNAQRRSASLVGREDDNDALRLRSNDVRSILTRGAASGYAEVDFKAGDGQRYRARWQVRRANNRPDGRLQPQSMSLTCLDDDTVYSGKKTEVLTRIEQLVGLDYGQFRRSVMLAQGDFAAFLKADAKERSELLERMTGTEIYSQLSRQAFEVAKQKEQALQSLQAQLAGIELLEPDTLEELQQQLQSLVSEQQQLRQIQQHLLSMQEQQKQVAEISDTCKLASQEQQRLQQSWQEGEAARAQLDQVERAQAARACYQQRESLQLALASHEQQAQHAREQEQETARLRADAQQQLDSAQQQQRDVEGLLGQWQPKLEQAVKLQAQQDELQASLKREQHNLQPVQHRLNEWQQQLQVLQSSQQQDQANLAAVKQQLQQLGPFSSLAERHQELEMLLPTCARELSEFGQTEAAQRQLSLDTDNTNLILRQDEAAQKELEQLLGGAEKQKQTWEQALADMQAPALQSQYENLHNESDWLRQLLPQMEKGLQLQQQSAALAARLQEVENDRQQCALQHTELEQKLVPVTTQLQEAERNYRQQLAVIRLEEFRGELRDNEPCPLCGSETHPYMHTHPQVQSVLQVQQQRVEQLNYQLQQMREQLSHLSALSQQHERLTHELQQEHQHQHHLLQQLQQFWFSLRGQSLPDSILPMLQLEWLNSSDNHPVREAMASLAERLARVQHEQAQLSRELQQQQQLRHNLDQLATEIAPLQRNLQLVQQRITDLRADQTQQVAQQAQNAQQLERLQQSLGQALERLNQLSPEINWAGLFSDARLFEQESAQLLQSLQLYLDQQQQQTQLLQAIQQRNPQLSHAQQSVEELQAQTHVGEQAIQSLQQRCDELQAQLQALLERRSLMQVREWLDSQSLAARKAVEGSSEGLQQRMQAHVSAQQTLFAAEQQAQQLQQQKRRSLQEWQDWQQKLEMNESTLLSGLRHDQDWLQHQRQLQQQQHMALQQAKTRLEERQQALAKATREAELAADKLVMQLKLEVDAQAVDLEQLQQMSQQHSERQHQLEEQVFKLRSQIEADQQARTNQAGLVKQIDSFRQQSEVWLDLRELIGSADGTRFRIFAQSLTLDNLLALANRQLQQLSPRYCLQRVPGNDLGLQVIDQEMGDEVRSVESLSGGESFLVSLSLALGLASLSSQKTELESLFIDEGFGTLDPESLDIAIACLDALQSEGKQVGVISHVETLVERIGTQIRIETMGGGISRVNVMANTPELA